LIDIGMMSMIGSSSLWHSSPQHRDSALRPSHWLHPWHLNDSDRCVCVCQWSSACRKFIPCWFRVESILCGKQYVTPLIWIKCIKGAGLNFILLSPRLAFFWTKNWGNSAEYVPPNKAHFCSGVGTEARVNSSLSWSTHLLTSGVFKGFWRTCKNGLEMVLKKFKCVNQPPS